ncbi:hypothetical protein CE561_04700 [Thermoanaerobacterium thermosaccharolyticum]|jgi:hypothetical protein|uniref:Uncharacterized protein n=1 Tax=Thermoanaerobacterium thermosaccharolyticum TaxID=1517 RepID=A0A231VKE5_THETR|nr:hypothetical protein [Thermoanaerobacterium thermosaccharolyticum]OXT08597.1 hypothetical protein CE561_04700 [Thermoanaerobacterium thermosaccharolyticum]
MKMKLIKILTMGLAVMIFLGAGQYIFAKTTRTIGDYDTIVPGVGTWYSPAIEKANGSNGVNHNTSIGGGKTLLTAIAYGNNRITDEYALTPRSRVLIPYHTGENISGRKVRLQLNTPWNVLVDVEAHGTWSPDSED